MSEEINYKIGDVVVRKHKNSQGATDRWYNLKGSILILFEFKVYDIDLEGNSVYIRRLTHPEMDYGAWDADKFELVTALPRLEEYL